jgi:hypothetical protein
LIVSFLTLLWNYDRVIQSLKQKFMWRWLLAMLIISRTLKKSSWWNLVQVTAKTRLWRLGVYWICLETLAMDFQSWPWWLGLPNYDDIMANLNGDVGWWCLRQILP